MNKNSEKKTAVYQCKHFEFDDNDPAGCGESWSWCHSLKSCKKECDIRYVYSQKFCPFYKKGPLRGRWVIGESEIREAKEIKKKKAAMKAAEEDKMPDDIKRNFENYATRYEAFLAYQELKDSRKCPYWFKDKHQKSAFVVDFDDWLWLPVSDNPACPIAWKKEYLGIDTEV